MNRYLSLITGLVISAVAAWYSIIGLTTIFAGAVIPVAIMGIVLEAGKIVTASYLYRNWDGLGHLMRTYFTCAVLVLMSITSLGIFGFLSRAHIEATVEIGHTRAQIERVDVSLEQERRMSESLKKSLAQLDAAVDKMIGLDQISKGIALRNSQKKEREEISSSLETTQAAINKYLDERDRASKQIRLADAEVGPIRYVAEFIYGDSSSKHLDSAVRIVIMMLVFVFDPLALLLIVAFNRRQTDLVAHTHINTSYIGDKSGAQNS